MQTYARRKTPQILLTEIHDIEFLLSLIRDTYCMLDLKPDDIRNFQSI